MRASDITIRLTNDEASCLQEATAEVPYLLNHAAGVFDLLSSGFADGFLEGHAGVISVLELSARALRNAAAKEGEAVAQLDRKLLVALVDPQPNATAEPDGLPMADFVRQWAAQGNHNPDELRRT